MDANRASAFLYEQWKQKHNIPEDDDYLVDDGDFLDPELEFFALSIHELEKNHKPSEGWGLPCQHCEGTGGETHTENGAPHGAGYWPMSVSDVCGYCVDQGICPKCAGELIERDDGDYICKRCLYNASIGKFEVVQ